MGYKSIFCYTEKYREFLYAVFLVRSVAAVTTGIVPL